MDDLVKRSDVLEALDLCDFVRDNEYQDAACLLFRESVIEVIKALPSAERKRGRWIHERLLSTTGGSYPIVRCSVCSDTMPFEWATRFCPNCGAEIRGEEDE